jgi:predicted membrane metal-binding protein
MHIKSIPHRYIHIFFKGALLYTLLLLVACQNLPRVHALYDQTADLSRYSTFALHPKLEPKGEEYDSLAQRYIKAAIIVEMQKQGYRLSDTPELWVNFNTKTKDRVRVIDTPEPFSYHYYFFRHDYGVWGGYPYTETRIEQYTEGTLNIDVIDISNKRLLWEGIAVGTLSKRTMDNLEDKINEALMLIFEKYP